MRGVFEFFSFTFARLRRYFVRYRLFYACFIAAGVIFAVFPQIDLFISGLFYDPEKGGFYLSKTAPLMAVYHGVHYLTAFLIGVYVIILCADVLTGKNILGLRKKAVLFLAAALIAGPGLVVNTLLKDNVGRPRPEAVIQFGGDKTFTPAFALSDACDKNCSFVSGHAAFGFYLMSFGFLAAGSLRKKIFAAGFTAGVLISLVRIIQGRHFLSDTVFAFFFVFMTISLIYEFMYGDES